MQNLYDYKRYAVLYVDDEEKSLKYFTRAFEDQFRILTASSGDVTIAATPVSPVSSISGRL